MTTTTFKNYDFFPKLKTAAAEKYGADGFLIRNDDGLNEIFYPPTMTMEKPDPLLVEEGWLQEREHREEEDRFVGWGEVWEAVPNPGWPLRIDFQGREYALKNIAKGGSSLVALYRPDDPTAGGVYARLTDTGLDIWNPTELAARPFPAILGRNFLLDKTFTEALTEKGITVRDTELGWWKGASIARLEYVRDGLPRVAYEIVQADMDGFGSTSVVLSEPVVPDEHDLDWLYRFILGKEKAPDPCDE